MSPRHLYHQDRDKLTPVELFLVVAAEISIHNQEQIMKTQADALAALATLQKDVTTLIAQGGPAADFQSVVDATNAIDAQVIGAITPGGGTGNPPVASVGLGNPSQIIPIGTTAQLTATPLDAAGNPLPGRVVVWASSDQTVAGVDQNGLVTALKAGQTTISATCEGQVARDSVTVQ